MFINAMEKAIVSEKVECPAVFLANDYNTWAASGRTTNVKIYPDGCLNIRNARMNE